MNAKKATLRGPERFVRDEEGGMLAYGLTALLGMLIFGGLAVDVGNAYAVRTHLAIAADSAAHAAIYTRELQSEDVAKQRALEVFEVALPPEQYGTILTVDDIEFGTWDEATRVFTPSPYSKQAVRVLAERSSQRNNSVGTFLLGLAGLDSWDVRRDSIFQTYMPTCLREGFVAEEIVDVQSNNAYTNGFCIHSNTHVEVNQSNYFAENTIVSMPDRSDLVLPESGFESNDGLAEALRDGAYRLRILDRLAEIMEGLDDPSSGYMPDYIVSSVPIELPSRNVSDADFTPGRIHTYTCSGPHKLKVANGSFLNEIVIDTNCPVELGQGTILDNAIIATSNTTVDSISAPAQVQIGRDDNCAPDGGAQLVTLGGISFPSQMRVYGGQMLAMDDIEFSAEANGIEGASFISGGTISGTSNMTMGFCGSGMEDNFEASYFRLTG
ncbi:hypothetical protein Ga0609869_000225 [Rhodovulum iodosum]|uniref:Flp pilus-assembly TadG-like N-terminal domain-containing protein n=1 Tax=Rhodovulum iodosum TaxID=68291 RepID=A0ABV3XNJ7_9RHOB|nr:pilus assembly protein TadG-related protein [Rhodovulum robiginosum]RSK34774.1 hypothetical protein EJA01_07395 [Rhodovulum robiginosum]